MTWGAPALRKLVSVKSISRDGSQVDSVHCKIEFKSLQALGALPSGPPLAQKPPSCRGQVGWGSPRPSCC